MIANSLTAHWVELARPNRLHYKRLPGCAPVARYAPYDLQVSPNGEFLSLICNGSLVLIDIGSEKLVRFPQEEATILSYSWQGDDALVFAARVGSRYPLDDDTPVSAAATVSPDEAEHGPRIVLFRQEVRSGEFRPKPVYVCPIQTAPGRGWRGPRYYEKTEHWSSNGRFTVLSLCRADGGLQLVDTVTGVPTGIGEPIEGESDVAWTPSGSKVLCINRRASGEVVEVLLVKTEPVSVDTLPWPANFPRHDSASPVAWTFNEDALLTQLEGARAGWALIDPAKGRTVPIARKLSAVVPTWESRFLGSVVPLRNRPGFSVGTMEGTHIVDAAMSESVFLGKAEVGVSPDGKHALWVERARRIRVREFDPPSGLNQSAQWDGPATP